MLSSLKGEKLFVKYFYMYQALFKELLTSAVPKCIKNETVRKFIALLGFCKYVKCYNIIPE